MKPVIVSILLVFQINTISAQELKFLTEVKCRSLRGGIECPDSSYIGIGIDNSFAGYDTIYCLADCDPDEDTIITEKWLPDFYLIKVNKAGDTLWTKKSGGLGDDWLEDIKAIDEDYIVTGYSSSNSKGHYDFYVSRINSIGDTIWSILLGGKQCDWAFSSKVISNNEIYSIGSTYSFGNGRIGSDDIYLVKTSSTGDTIFTKTYGDSLNAETGLDIIQTTDKNFIILANSNCERNRAILIIKIDSLGEAIWTKNYKGDYSSSRILEDDQANLIITGTKYRFGDNYDEDLFLFKLNQNGDSIWLRSYGELRENGYYINLTNDNNYIICASSGGINGGKSDLGLFKISQSGELLWKRSFNLSDGGIDWGKYVKQTYDEGFIIIGTMGLGGSFILKTDANGFLSEINKLPYSSKALEFYPIPFSDNLTIYNNQPEKYICIIYNINGSSIITLDVEPGENQYDLSFLQTGNYLYRIINSKGYIIEKGNIIKTFANTAYKQWRAFGGA